MLLDRTGQLSNLSKDDSKIINSFKVALSDEKVKPKTFRAAYILKKIPSIEVWRFFVDGLLQGRGWTGFERRETGYLLAICKAFSFALENVSILSPMHLQILHYEATCGVKNLNLDIGTKNSTVLYDEFRSNLTSYTSVQFKDSLIEPNEKNQLNNHKIVLKEVMNKIASGQHNYLYLITKDSAGKIVKEITSVNIGSKESFDTLAEKLLLDIDSLYFCSIPLADKPYSDFIKEFIARYEAEIILAKNDFDKILEAIIKLISDLHHLHPFSDGNTRTFGMVLLNQLLLSNGLLPAILSNPNDFERYPMPVLKEKIINGMKNVFRLCMGLPVYNIITSKMYESYNLLEKEYFHKSISVLEKYFQSPEMDSKNNKKYLHKASAEEIVDVVFKLYNAKQLGEQLLDLFVQSETRQKAFELGLSILSGQPIHWKFTHFQSSKMLVVTPMSTKGCNPKCCV